MKQLPNDDEIVTRGILRVELKKEFSMFEKRFKKRFERKIDQKLARLEARLEERLEARLGKKIDERVGHYAGVLMEYMDEKFQIMFEGFQDLPRQVVTLKEQLEKNDEEHSIFRAQIQALE